VVTDADPLWLADVADIAAADVAVLSRRVASPTLPMSDSTSPGFGCVHNNRILSRSTALWMAACCAPDLLAAAPELASVAQSGGSHVLLFGSSCPRPPTCLPAALLSDFCLLVLWHHRHPSSGNAASKLQCSYIYTISMQPSLKLRSPSNPGVLAAAAGAVRPARSQATHEVESQFISTDLDRTTMEQRVQL
jgi:hypothetical protein